MNARGEPAKPGPCPGEPSLCHHLEGETAPRAGRDLELMTPTFSVLPVPRNPTPCHLSLEDIQSLDAWVIFPNFVRGLPCFPWVGKGNLYFISTDLCQALPGGDSDLPYLV